jgi:hypothetical protein
MKKYVIWCVLLSFVCLTAQNKVAQKITDLQNARTNFSRISIFNTESEVDEGIAKIVREATITSYNKDKGSQLMINKSEYLELEIPFQDQIVSLLLYQVNPMAEGFHVDTDKRKNIGYEKGLYYRGIIKGDPKSIASFNFFNGECNGVFSNATFGNVVVGKLKTPGNSSRYIIYSESKMNVVNTFDCHVKESEWLPNSNFSSSKSALSNRCASIYFEIDYDLYTTNNSSELETTNWLTSVFNNIQTLYDNDGISVAIKSVFIWTSQDPYNGIGTTSFEYLSAFGTNTPIFDADLGQLVGIDPGGLGGVAIAINGLCSQNNYSYSDVNVEYENVPTFSWTIQVMTHELGHLLGSPHTHGCYWNGNSTAIDGCGPTADAGYTEGNCDIGPLPAGSEGGTIMSYCHLVSGIGINLANGFGPQPAALILDTVNSASCLSTDCINTCINMITNVEVSNITDDGALIVWNESGDALSWQVSVTPFSSTNIVWNTVTTQSFEVIGLEPNTYYIVRVRPICLGDAISASKEQIFATANTDLCNYAFTDTGGSSLNYTDMESWTRTLMPTGNGLKVKVTFTSFNLETNWDYLYIYNGPDDTYPEMTNGGLTGATLPPSYTSTSNSGALTFKFYSDQAINRSGWNANISCIGTLGDVRNDFMDFSYFPNPTSGIVAISSKDTITEINIFNIQGQLLFIRKVNELSANVDLATFASGTYFFKLKFNDKEANFKILKL